VVVCVALAAICPQEIARINRQALHRLWWSDPVYQAIVAKRIEGETCHYCGQRPATLPHHDEDWMYLTKEAYYDPANMTPACGKCHWMYRRGYVICPACKMHYMRHGSDKCQHCRGIRVYARRKPHHTSRKRRLLHPCGHRLTFQRCTVHGICTHSWKRARECGGFEERQPCKN
jgi:hypothetical protein